MLKTTHHNMVLIESDTTQVAATRPIQFSKGSVIFQLRDGRVRTRIQ